MAFGIGTNCQVGDAGVRPGVQQEIACQCWYTASGKGIPVMIKVKDEEEIIHTIRGIRVNYSEKKNYAGVPSLEYVCEIDHLGWRRNVKLIFLVNENKWVLQLL